MTLILAYANPQFAVMAADRRITRGSVLETDKQTKMAIWEGKLMFSYTGLAEIGVEREDTISVLAKILAGQKKFNPLPIADLFKQKLNEMVISRKDKRLAILGVGFNDLGKTVYWIISNTYGHGGKVLNEATESFQILYNLPITESSIQVYGLNSNLNYKARNNLLTRLRHTRGTSLPSEGTIMNILGGAISDSAGPTISKESLVCTMFRDVRIRSVSSIKGQHNKPGAIVDFATPLIIKNGGVITMPSQRLRLARKKRSRSRY